MSAAFDTLEISKRLKGAGVDDAQAEAITGVLRESREADLSRLATKDDIAHVKDDIAGVETSLRGGISGPHSVPKWRSCAATSRSVSAA